MEEEGRRGEGDEQSGNNKLEETKRLKWMAGCTHQSVPSMSELYR